MREGNAKPCFTANLLSGVENSEDTKHLDEVFVSATGTLYGAGADTTVASLTAFVLAIIMFPEAQVAAHAELDRVLGRKRFPEIEDQESLPRVTALVHELLRWHPVGPLALPHRTIADDYYQGYYIPAGTTVFGNCWAILHDENTFPDPEAFKPERFLNEDGSLRDDVPYPTEAFGFGRRICPGRYFAHDMIWLAVAHMLSVFKIERAVDESGNEINLEGEFTPHYISMPKPFKCRFTSRFPEAEALIRSATLTD